MYEHPPNEGWKTARPYGVDYRGGPDAEDTLGVVVRLDGALKDLTISNLGHLGHKTKCLETEDGSEWSLACVPGAQVRPSPVRSATVWNARAKELLLHTSGRVRLIRGDLGVSARLSRAASSARRSPGASSCSYASCRRRAPRRPPPDVRRQHPRRGQRRDTSRRRGFRAAGAVPGQGGRRRLPRARDRGGRSGQGGCGAGDLAVCGGTWDAKCLEREDGHDVVLSYAGGPGQPGGQGPSGLGRGTSRGARWHTRTGNTPACERCLVGGPSSCTLSGVCYRSGSKGGAGLSTTVWSTWEW